MKRTFVVLIALLSFSSLLAQWQKTGCPDEYTISALQTKGDTVFASDGNKMYISADNGLHWEDFWNFFPWPGYFNTIVYSGSNIYVGTDDGVYLSTDNGQSFILKNNGSAIDFVTCIDIYSENIYIGATQVENNKRHGAFCSTDNCEHWINISGNFPDNLRSIFEIILIDNQLFAATEWDVYVSSDGGQNWAALNVPYNDIHAFSVVADTILFAGGWSGLCKSVDFGGQWTAVVNGLPDDLMVEDLLVSGQNIFLASFGQGFYFSKDFGATWNDGSDGLSVMNIEPLAVNDHFIFTGLLATPGFYTGGVFRRPVDEVQAVDYIFDNHSFIDFYPNPAHDFFTLKLNHSGNTGTLLLNNLDGREIFRKKILDGENNIDISELPVGIYFAKLTSGENVEVIKILKF